jgi:hypothetical protein
MTVITADKMGSYQEQAAIVEYRVGIRATILAGYLG